MAIDKNSKAYQSLLNSGYTDEQITQMHDQMASGASAQTALGNQQPPYAGNVDQSTYKGTDANGNVTVGPQNANLNYNQYGDDSNPNQQSQRGGLNEKYTGEGVSNTYIDYNPNLRLGDLDPNYLYGDAARQQNRKEAGYIARRNDQIASALYNEGLVSREDVANWLGQQKEWMNSTEEDRLNTIESVWKRLGQIKPEEPEEEPDLSKADELVQDTSGKIYGKTTAEEGDPQEGIDTLADANSAFRSTQEQRSLNLKALVLMDSQKVGYMMSEGLSPFSEQTMRDLQQLYPEKYAEIQKEIKKIKGQQDINNISTGGKMDITSQLTASESNVTTSMNAAVNQTANGSGAGTLATNLNNALSDSEIVSGAREQMEVYKRKIQEIQDAAAELPELANKYFKGDVPDYMVKAFINNRMQQYNKELEKYQSLYNASLQEAQMEISQQQWREEMNYKWSSLEADKNYKNANLALSQKELEYNRQKAAISNGQWNDDGTYSYVDLDGKLHTLSAEEAQSALSSDLYNKATEYIDYWRGRLDSAKAKGGAIIGGQCEAFTDNFARQYFGTEMVGDGHTWTTAEEKAAYATEALPQRGFIAVWNYKSGSKASVKYGHTGIVIDYDPKTGTFTTLESNVDGRRTLSVQKHSINEASLQGFRDPSKGESAKNGGNGNKSTPIDTYMDLPNGMLDVFIGAENAGKTVEERKYARQGREGYGILNMMKNNGELESVVGGDEIAGVFDEFTKYLTENASNRLIVDEDGNFVFDTVLQSMINSGKIVSAKERDALAHLYRLVQIKLRRDSGAAINIGEWMGDYNMYLPQAGLSRKQKLQRLMDLERAAIESVMPGDYIYKYVPLITEEMVNAESEEALRDEAEDILKNNR